VAKCDICGKEEYLPYRCKYCGGVFCYEHRLPENHNCPGIRRVDEYWNVPVKVKRVRTVEVPRRRAVKVRHLNSVIIGICTAVLILKYIAGPVVDEYIALNPSEIFRMPWQIVTSIFDHAGLVHYFVNMLVLYFFGGELERRIGSKKYLSVFLISGIAGNLAYIVYAYMTNPFIPALGASAAIFGVMGALAVLAPYITVIIFPLPIPINIRWAILFFALYDLILLPYSMQTGVAHISHLAGLAVGILMGRRIYETRIRLD